MEKGVSALLVPGIIVPFLYTTPITDGIFCAMMTLHSYWHTEAMVVDYIRPKLFGGNTFIPNLCRALCFALHAFILGALFYYNYTDIGIINSMPSSLVPSSTTTTQTLESSTPCLHPWCPLLLQL